MKQEIQLFSNEQFGEIRTTLDEKGNVLFCLADVCKALDIANPRQVKSRLDSDETQLIDLHAVCFSDGIVGNSLATFVTESGLYSVILRSNKEGARIFRKWVTSEVLPSIRKTGQYSVNLPQDYLSALKALVKAEEEKLVAQARLAEMQPKADYCDTILRSRDSMVVSQIAKDYGMSAKKFNTLLFDLGVQYRVNGQWLLYAEHAGRGYVDSKTASFTHSNGDPGSSLLTVWTQKGRLFLYNLLKQRDVRPVCEQEGRSVLPSPANVSAASHE